MRQSNSPVIESLEGSFLISTQKMMDPRFEEQVILICAHNSEGAMGVAINKPNPMITVADVLSGSEIKVPDFPLPPVHIGGPVEIEAAFILYESDYVAEYQWEVTPTVSISRQPKVLEDIAHGIGPEKYLFIIGYAGWGPGQLETELASDGWLTLPANENIIFDIPDEDKWRTAAMHYGIDISTFGDVIGYA